MALLVEVFSELFRSFGYSTRLHGELEGRSGKTWSVPLLVEKDNRRLAALLWLDTQPLPEATVDETIELVRDAQLDGGLLLSLGAVPEVMTSRAARSRVQVWDSARITDELGTAVLRETLPTVWDHLDPLVAPRPSRILEQVHHEARAEPTPPVPQTPLATVAPTTAPAPSPPPVVEPSTAAPTPPPTPEPTSVAALPPQLASPERVVGQLTLPAAFGPPDRALPAPPAPRETAEAPPSPPPFSARQILRMQVSRDLALSLVKGKIRHVERVFLRLVPYHVFDYEASLLIEGSLQVETQRGRMGVDAALKRVLQWHHAMDVGELPREGVDLDEKKVRIAETEARALVLEGLKNLVTRDVVMQEDDSEWSVVVKKKVTLAEEEIRLTPRGLYWLPLWRVTGKDGSMEIDAATGQVAFEELLQQRADAQLV